MLSRIQTGPKSGSQPAGASLADALRSGDTSDAVDLLLGCHQRIRHFTAMARRLAAPGAPMEQIGAAARAVYHYYHAALPLHEADENQSVYPRLRAAAPPAELAAANQAMLEQHVAIDGVVAALLPLWAALEARPQEALATAELSAQLDQAWQEHLDMEEQLIFPALRTYLSPQDRADIRREMAERRQIGS